MSSLLNSEDVSYRTGILMRHFETFSSGRYLVVHKAPTKTVQSISSNPIPGYGASSNESNITYSYISGVFPAMAVFDNNLAEQLSDIYNEDLKQAVKTYQDSLQFRTAAKNSAVISAAPGTYRSHTECKRDLLLNDAEFLLERANTFAVHDQNCGGFPCYREGIASDQLLSAIKEKTLRGTKLTTAQLIPDIEKYCESDSCQKSPFDDFDLQILKQVIAAVS